VCLMPVVGVLQVCCRCVAGVLQVCCAVWRLREICRASVCVSHVSGRFVAGVLQVCCSVLRNVAPPKDSRALVCVTCRLQVCCRCVAGALRSE